MPAQPVVASKIAELAGDVLSSAASESVNAMSTTAAGVPGVHRTLPKHQRRAS